MSFEGAVHPEPSLTLRAWCSLSSHEHRRIQLSQTSHDHYVFTTLEPFHSRGTSLDQRRNLFGLISSQWLQVRSARVADTLVLFTQFQ